VCGELLISVENQQFAPHRSFLGKAVRATQLTAYPSRHSGIGLERALPVIRGFCGSQEVSCDALRDGRGRVAG